MGHPAKVLMVSAIRGFKSHPLRHFGSLAFRSCATETLNTLSVDGWRFVMLRAARSVIPVFCGAMVVCGGLFVSCARDSHPLSDLDVSLQSQSVDETNSLPSIVSAPPTTSGVPVPSVEDHVRSDFVAAMAAREKCDYKPDACDFAAVSAQGSEMDLVTRQTMTMYTDNNLRAVAGRGDVLIRVESVKVSGSDAALVSCVFDTEVIVDVGRASGAFDDVVFDDSQRSDRVRWRLELADGSWRIISGERLQTLTGGDLCDF